MDEFPGNSRRPTSPLGNPVVPPPADEVKLDKVVTGTVLRRKKSLGRRFKETFLGTDSHSVVGYVVQDVLIPAVRNLVVDMVTQGIERTFYGEVRSPSRGMRGSTYPRTHISYDRQSSISRPVRPEPPMRRPVTQPSAVELGDIILDTQINAQVVVDKLYEILQEYNAATVANLNDLLGQTSAYTDHNYGWTDLTSMTVRRVREGYLLVLPEPQDLR